MKLVKLNKRNLKLALKTAFSIFKDKYSRKYIKEWYGRCITGEFKHINSYLQYYLVYEKNTLVGITGIYRYPEQNDCWLGWFGVLQSERRKGVGSQILLETMKRARKLGCKRLRLWTAYKTSQLFYETNGFKKSQKESWVVVNGKKIWKYPSYAVFYYKRLD